jgi:MFS family permease
MGLTMAGLGLGGLVYPPLCAFVIEHFGWRTAYLVFAGVCYLLVLPPLLLFVKDRPSELGLLPDGLESDAEGGKKEHALVGVSVRRAVRSSNFVLLVGLYMTQLYVMSLIGVNTPIFATDAGYSLQVASYFMAFALGVTVIGRFLFGVLCDHVNPKILVAAVGFLLMGSVLVLELCVAKLGWTGYRPVWLFAVFQGLAISGSVIVLAILVGRCFGEREFPKIMGLVTAGFAVGVVLGGPSAGYIYDKTGSYEIAFFLCVAVALISVVLALLVRPHALRAEFGSEGN